MKRPHRPAAGAALAAVLWAWLALASTTSRPAAGVKPKATGTGTRAGTVARVLAATRSPLEQAKDVIALNDLGAYGQAVEALRALRRRVRLDADLEIALALAEGRTGDLDSAAARLYGPTLEAAVKDSLPESRRFDYQFGYERLWLDGKFSGWNWYVARARAEVQARRGHWPEAYEAAQACVAARPLAGKEHLILAIAAGKTGRLEESERAARTALWLDPTLPEAYYAVGIFEWKAGRRVQAQERFRQAVALDSSYREPALALARLRLPGARPDSLPSELLTGLRACGLVASADRPKLEEFVQMEVPVVLTREAHVVMPDSIPLGKPIDMDIPILVDPHGRIALHELPAYNPVLLPAPAVNIVLSTLPLYEFEPARLRGRPTPVWTAVQVVVQR